MLYSFRILDISAYPPNVNILDGIENDVRTPDKLVNGVNDTSDGSNMWLAPILPSEVSNVFIFPCDTNKSNFL
jgi:hypothetical protein